ncbi:PREDICTED: hemicentin-1-like [Priapulus caudatus]|uniref:Hemicentin-1-like n=1 Tax=Priapulus caudatus TaxID=37621 RepID=A0ABM1EDC6_PRICU|nr:PREDICTED: hemicentin-1-like [Priapulus caudatus]
MVQGWSGDKLREFCAERGMEWKFITPGAPHQNGCAESLVKSCKYALKRAIGEQTLTPFELYTCLLEVANLVNQRPIGRIPTDPDDGSYLSPNDMLFCRLGCAHSDVTCSPGALYAEYLQYKFVSLPSGVEAGSDLMQLVAYDGDGRQLRSPTFTITDNDSSYGFAIRTSDDSGRGVLYAVRGLADSTQYRLVVVAREEAAQEGRSAEETSFVIYIYVSAYPF